MKCLVRYNRKSFYTLSLQKSSNYSQLFSQTISLWTNGQSTLTWPWTKALENYTGSILKLCPFGRILKTVKSESFSKFFDQTSQKRPESCRHCVLSEEKIEFFRKFNWWHDIIYRHIGSFSSWSWNTRITAFICITLFLLWASFLFCFIQNFQSSNS